MTRYPRSLKVHFAYAGRTNYRFAQMSARQRRRMRRYYRWLARQVRECPHDPTQTFGPIGMYHCPLCGTMVLAGLDHPREMI